MTSFDKYLAPFIDEDGLVLEKPNAGPGPNTGNGIHGLCVVTLIKILRNELTEQDRTNFCRVIDSCRLPMPGTEGAFFIAGLFNRGPRKTEELISHDDYRALASVSSLLGTPYHKWIISYGTKNLWIFNNLDPGSFSWSAWHGRFPGLVSTYRLMDTEGFTDQDVENVAQRMWMASLSSDPGGNLLTWLEASALRGRFPTVDRYIATWRRSVGKCFGSVGGLLEAYYGAGDFRAMFCPE